MLLFRLKKLNRMSDDSSIINKWVPNKVLLPLLSFALFPHLILLSMFSMNTTFTASFLDVEPDDLQFVFATAYATTIAGLFVYNRLWNTINVRSYLLLTTILNILILVGMTITRNQQLLYLLRIIQGPLALFEGTILLPVIMSRIKSIHAKYISYSILYALIMTSDKFSTSLVKFAITHYNHNMMIYIIIGLHAIALLIYLVVFNVNRMFPKKPLYQLNLGGVFLLLISLLSGAFFLIYGKRYNWLESSVIVMALINCCVFSSLFIIHQKTSKHPLFHFEIFKSERVIIGVLLFVVFYTLRSSMSNIYQIMGIVWKWPWEYVLQIQYINVVGTFMGCITSYILFSRQISFKSIFTVGFFLMAVSMFWFSYLFYPDTSVEAIGPPLFLEGLAQGIIFTPLVFYMLGSVHINFTNNVAQTGTTIRFWTTTFGFALMQNLVWYLSTKHEFMLTKNLDLTQPIFQKEWNTIFGKFGSDFLINDAMHLSVAALKTKLAEQALLVANMEIFRGLFIVALITLMAIISYSYLRKLVSK